MVVTRETVFFVSSHEKGEGVSILWVKKNVVVVEYFREEL